MTVFSRRCYFEVMQKVVGLTRRTASSARRTAATTVVAKVEKPAEADQTTETKGPQREHAPRALHAKKMSAGAAGGTLEFMAAVTERYSTADTRAELDTAIAGGGFIATNIRAAGAGAGGYLVTALAPLGEGAPRGGAVVGNGLGSALNTALLLGSDAVVVFDKARANVDAVPLFVALAQIVASETPPAHHGESITAARARRFDTLAHSPQEAVPLLAKLGLPPRLLAAAPKLLPELSHLWDFAPLPGVAINSPENKLRADAAFERVLELATSGRIHALEGDIQDPRLSKNTAKLCASLGLRVAAVEVCQLLYYTPDLKGVLHTLGDLPLADDALLVAQQRAWVQMVAKPGPRRDAPTPEEEFLSQLGTDRKAGVLPAHEWLGTEGAANADRLHTLAHARKLF